MNLIKKIWDKNPFAWKDSTAEQQEIVNRLGWLDIAQRMKGHTKELKMFAAEIRREGFTSVMLLGMGGSSLAPELFQRVFGNKKGCPKLWVLDSTDPERVRDIEKKVDLKKTLFIVSSKSGGTIELVSFFKYFYAKVNSGRPANDTSAGRQFVAITDPSTALGQLAAEKGFRRVFISDPDIGGRFSALSYFGLVPAALIGVDIKKLLDRACRMMAACSAKVLPARNAAAGLGLKMAELAAQKKDKLTLWTSPGLESFGDWAEQLVAESTGKEGKGVVPVLNEQLEAPAAYGKDRFFVTLQLGKKNASVEKRLKALEKAGHPVLRLRLKDKYDIGGEFFRWEMATAIACAQLKINAFDQPDVQAAKDSAKRLLKELDAGRRLVVPHGKWSPPAFCRSIKKGDYVGILAFVPDRAPLKDVLERFQSELRRKTRAAVTLGLGPRYLHSTGQLHKGGANNGAFILITTEHSKELEIPGERYGFAGLEFAQAIGDLEALKGRGRRVLHLHLTELSVAALRGACRRVSEAYLR